MKYLVINNSNNGIYSYAEKYQLFSKRKDAIAHFKAIGGDDDNHGMGLSDRLGTASIDKCGLLDITFLPIEEQ